MDHKPFKGNLVLKELWAEQQDLRPLRGEAPPASVAETPATSKAVRVSWSSLGFFEGLQVQSISRIRRLLNYQDLGLRMGNFGQDFSGW